jgi:hypothetical protein
MYQTLERASKYRAIFIIVLTIMSVLVMRTASPGLLRLILGVVPDVQNPHHSLSAFSHFHVVDRVPCTYPHDS